MVQLLASKEAILMASGPTPAPRTRRQTLSVNTRTLPAGRPAASGWSALTMLMEFSVFAVFSMLPRPDQVVQSLLIITGMGRLAMAVSTPPPQARVLGPTITSPLSIMALALAIGLLSRMNSGTRRSFM